MNIDAVNLICQVVCSVGYTLAELSDEVEKGKHATMQSMACFGGITYAQAAYTVVVLTTEVVVDVEVEVDVVVAVDVVVVVVVVVVVTVAEGTTVDVMVEVVVEVTVPVDIPWTVMVE